MRAGRVIGTLPTADATVDQLVEMMIGEHLIWPELGAAHSTGNPVLRIVEMVAESDQGNQALAGVNVEVHEGEILGVAGVSGNGQHELAEVIVGLRTPLEGKVYIHGKDLTYGSPRQRIEAGVSYIPGDRLRMGLVPDLSVAENLILKGYRWPDFHKGPFLDVRKVAAHAQHLISSFDIAVPSREMPVLALSGGNQQKTILARELSEPHCLLIVEYPTRGLDVRASAFVHQQLRQERQKGTAILMISNDLDELMMLSDRIVVMYEGRIVGEMRAEEADARQLGLLMAGKTVIKSGNGVL